MFRDELVTFIQQQLVGDASVTPISATTELIEGGIVDSMGLMRIVHFIEERAGVRVPDHEVAPDNFETVTAIAALVDRLQGRRG